MEISYYIQSGLWLLLFLLLGLRALRGLRARPQLRPAWLLALFLLGLGLGTLFRRSPGGGVAGNSNDPNGMAPLLAVGDDAADALLRLIGTVLPETALVFSGAALLLSAAAVLLLALSVAREEEAVWPGVFAGLLLACQPSLFLWVSDAPRQSATLFLVTAALWLLPRAVEPTSAGTARRLGAHLPTLVAIVLCAQTTPDGWAMAGAIALYAAIRKPASWVAGVLLLSPVVLSYWLSTPSNAALPPLDLMYPLRLGPWMDPAQTALAFIVLWWFGALAGWLRGSWLATWSGMCLVASSFFLSDLSAMGAGPAVPPQAFPVVCLVLGCARALDRLRVWVAESLPARWIFVVVSGVFIAATTSYTGGFQSLRFELQLPSSWTNASCEEPEPPLEFGWHPRTEDLRAGTVLVLWARAHPQYLHLNYTWEWTASGDCISGFEPSGLQTQLYKVPDDCGGGSVEFHIRAVSEENEGEHVFRFRCVANDRPAPSGGPPSRTLESPPSR